MARARTSSRDPDGFTPAQRKWLAAYAFALAGSAYDDLGAQLEAGRKPLTADERRELAELLHDDALDIIGDEAKRRKWAEMSALLGRPRRRNPEQSGETPSDVARRLTV